MVDPASCWNLEEANYASWGTSHTDNDGAGSGSPFFVAKYAERNVSLLITQIVALLESRPVPIIDQLVLLTYSSLQRFAQAILAQVYSS